MHQFLPTAYLDKSPTSNANRTVRIPVGNRKIASLGAGWAASDNLTIDLAYAYIRESTSGVNQAAATGSSTSGILKPAYSARYRNSAHGFTGQASWHF